MDGIVNIIKELLSSKLSCAGVCFTAAVMHYGPRVIEIPALPQDWRWVPFVTMVLTGFFCAWWALVPFGRVIRALLRNLTRPTPDLFGALELQLLRFTELQDGVLNLKLLWTLENAPDRVESTLAREQLMRYGLIFFSRTDKRYYLTKAGYEFVFRHRDKIRQAYDETPRISSTSDGLMLNEPSHAVGERDMRNSSSNDN